MKTLQYDCDKCKRVITEYLEEQRGSYCHHCLPPLSKEEMRGNFGFAEINTAEYLVGEHWSGEQYIVTLRLDSFAKDISTLEYYGAGPNSYRLDPYGIKRVLRFETPEAFRKYVKQYRHELMADWMGEIFMGFFDE